MSITTKDTNIIVLYGDGAVELYSQLVNRWSRMISSVQWRNLHFFLAASKMPELNLEDNVRTYVDDRNTSFYQVGGEDGTSEPAPDSSTYHNMIFDKVNTGNVRLHIVYDSNNGDYACEWLKTFIRSACSVGALTTTCMYYLFFGRNSFSKERERLADLLSVQPGTTFLLGDTNETGGRVPAEDRRQAAILAILMNAAGLIPVGRGAYSLGYSALNANGSELRRLSESAACRALKDELGKTIDSLSGDLVLQLLPDGVSSTTGIYSWLKQYVQENMPQPETAAIRNAWVTIRMDPELSSVEAVRRMQRFADLNYTGPRNTETPAKELAWRTEKALMVRLRENPATVQLSDRVLTDIAETFRQIAKESVQPAGCTYPRKPMMLIGGAAKKEEYAQQCKHEVLKPIREYILRKNVCCFAEELEKVYRRAAEWVRKARGDEESDSRRMTARELLQDIQKELDSSDEGNALRIGAKYKNYARELEAVHPHLTALTEGVHAEYFREDGSLQEQAWRNLIRQAGKNMEKRLPGQFRGDFFKVLTSEFSTTDERERFFDEYLKSGPRMYMNLNAAKSNGTEAILADDRLTDKWFSVKNPHEVKTDNAENLTVYPLGNETPEYYLADKTVYFLNNRPGATAGQAPRKSLFSSDSQGERPPVRTGAPKSSLFGGVPSGGNGPLSSPVYAEDEEPGAKTASGTLNPPVRLKPDEKNMYRLYWDWRGNDTTAMVEMFQFGEKVGKVAVISVGRFKENGDNMNVTDEVMAGKPLPAGILTVTIRDAHQNIFIDSVEVQGRRDVVRYKLNNTKLQLQPEKSGLMEHVVLRSTGTDGNHTYFPLYPAAEGTPWLFEGLNLSEGSIMEDPTNPTGLIYPVRVE